MQKKSLLQYILSDNRIKFTTFAWYFYRNKIFLFFLTITFFMILSASTLYKVNMKVNISLQYKESFNIELLAPKFRNVLDNEKKLNAFSDRYKNNVIKGFMIDFFKMDKYEFINKEDRKDLNTLIIEMYVYDEKIFNSNKDKIILELTKMIKDKFEEVIETNVVRYNYSNDINIGELRKSFKVKNIEAEYQKIGIHPNFFPNFLLSVMFAVVLVSVRRQK